MSHRFDVDLGNRLRGIRSDLCGEYGVQFMADRLGILVGTWMNYERGVVVPGEVILAVLVETGANPAWLLSGDGAKFISLSRRTRSQFLSNG